MILLLLKKKVKHHRNWHLNIRKTNSQKKGGPIHETADVKFEEDQYKCQIECTCIANKMHFGSLVLALSNKIRVLLSSSINKLSNLLFPATEANCRTFEAIKNLKGNKADIECDRGFWLNIAD